MVNIFQIKKKLMVYLFYRRNFKSIWPALYDQLNRNGWDLSNIEGALSIGKCNSKYSVVNLEARQQPVWNQKPSRSEPIIFERIAMHEVKEALGSQSQA